MDDYPTRADEVREAWKRKEKPVTPIERLRALEKKWRDELPYKGSAWEERHDIIEECADELAILIAELGQEVAPVAWLVEWTDEDDGETVRVSFEHKRGAENRAAEVGGDARVIPLYTSPSSGREAMDSVCIDMTPHIQTGAIDEQTVDRAITAAMNQARVEGFGLCSGKWDTSFPTRAMWMAAIDAAMRQEGGE